MDKAILSDAVLASFFNTLEKTAAEVGWESYEDPAFMRNAGITTPHASPTKGPTGNYTKDPATGKWIRTPTAGNKFFAGLKGVGKKVGMYAGIPAIILAATGMASSLEAPRVQYADLRR